MKTNLIFIHALSPLHSGTGEGVGVIDAPVAREKATGIPFLPGSTVKGVLRAACEDEKKQEEAFGAKIGAESGAGGKFSFTDSRLLLLPVRSLAGVFAWVTSPLLLARLARDAELAGWQLPAVPAMNTSETCLVVEGKGSNLPVPGAAKVIIEDLPLSFEPSNSATMWAQKLGEAILEDGKALLPRFCIVSDDIMSSLMQNATEVRARISIDQGTGAAKDTALWYEELLPVETILAGVVAAGPDAPWETVAALCAQHHQLGGDATVGQGLCKVILWEPKNA